MGKGAVGETRLSSVAGLRAARFSRPGSTGVSGLRCRTTCYLRTESVMNGALIGRNVIRPWYGAE